uniref:Protein kinase domain-containing protein n=1 Tax=Alexandrium monilatum TaxID=311494 RepID=A0A7S4UL37_9DINO
MLARFSSPCRPASTKACKHAVHSPHAMGCGSLVAAGPRYVAPGEEASTAAVKLELAAAPDEPHTAPQPARDFRFEASAAALAWVHGPPPAAGCAANVVPPEAVRTHASAPSRPARGTSGGGDCPGSTRFEQPDGRPAPSDRDDLDYGPCFGPLTLDARTLERCSVPPESYELLSALDETNNSTVFLAEWKASRERVAVKRVRKRGSGQPFRTHANEVRVLSRLDHPCLARLIGIVDTPPQLDIVLEYCAGGDLHSYVRGGAGQGWDFLDLLCDVARGLAHMHEEWFAHLDVKPGPSFGHGCHRQALPGPALRLRHRHAPECLARALRRGWHAGLPCAGGGAGRGV